MIEFIRDHQAGVKHKRSTLWPATKREYKETVKAIYGKVICEACGRKKWLIFVHHIMPFHIFPDKENDQENLICLCSWCHLTLGHLRNWRSWNAKVREDADYLFSKIKRRPF